MSVKYVWLGIIFIIVSGIVLFCLLYEYEIEFGILEIVAYVTGLTATLTLIYHAFSLEYQIKSQRENNEILRAKHTWEIISEFTKPSMKKSICDIRKLVNDPERTKELCDPNQVENFSKYLDSNLKYRRNLILILNYFENISLMVETNHIDQGIVRKCFKELFIGYYSRLKHYIDHRQKEYGASWMYFEKISKMWIEEQKSA